MAYPTNGVKISMLPPYTGAPIATGDIPISIAGVTYRINPSKIIGSSAGSGSLNRLDEFEVGAEGSPMEDGETAYVTDDPVKGPLLAAAAGVIVFAGGTLIPSFELSAGGQWAIKDDEGDGSVIFNQGVTTGTHILILTY